MRKTSLLSTLLTCCVCFGCHTTAGAGLGVGQRRHRWRRGGCPRGSRVWPAAACACSHKILLSQAHPICAGRDQAEVLHTAMGFILLINRCSGAIVCSLCNSLSKRHKCLAVRPAVFKAPHDMTLADCLHSHLRHGDYRHRASASGQARPLLAPSCFRLKGNSTHFAGAVLD